MISDRNSRRSKGIAYIEFLEVNSVPLAIGLTGQRLLGVPIIVQAPQVVDLTLIFSIDGISKCYVTFYCLLGRWHRLTILRVCVQAEKNRAAAMANNLQKGNAGPMRLYVGSLHFNITEDMLRGVFEPFGRVRRKHHYLSITF